MNRANFFLSLLVVAGLAFFIGYVVGSSTVVDEEGAISAEQAAKLPTIAKAIDMAPFKGSKHAKVTILEFSEFQ